MKKILVLAFALALSPALMAKGLHHSPKTGSCNNNNNNVEETVKLFILFC